MERDPLLIVQGDLERSIHGGGKRANEANQTLNLLNRLRIVLHSPRVWTSQRHCVSAGFQAEYTKIKLEQEARWKFFRSKAFRSIFYLRGGCHLAQSLKEFRDDWNLRLDRYDDGMLVNDHHYRRHESIFHDVVEYLRTGDKDVVILSGLFGMGKTEMALDIAKFFQIDSRFPGGAHFLKFDRNVSEGSSLESDVVKKLSELADRMRVADKTDVRQALTDAAMKKSCLIVLDNVWNPDSILHFRFRGHGGKILVTSRRKALWADAKVFHVDASDIAAKKLDEHLLVAIAASRGIKDLPTEVQGRILRGCGGCLALVYRIGNGLTEKIMGEIVQSSNGNSLGIWKEQALVLGSELDFSVKALNAGDRQLLEFLGLFEAGQAIPKDVIEDAWKLVHPSAKLTQIAMDTLVDFNLVTAGQDAEGTRVYYYSLHPLVSHYLLNEKPSCWRKVDKLPITMREFANSVVMDFFKHW